MKKLILGFLLFVSTSAFADWKEHTVILDVINVTDRSQITQALMYVKRFQDNLLSMDLASPSKLVIKSISAHVSYYKWSNDDMCQVSDPDKVEEERIENVSASYYFADHPAEVTSSVMVMGIASPCNGTQKTTNFR